MVELGSVVLTIFPKTPEDRSEENNNSVGLRTQYGGVSVLLPGDAETPERRWRSERAHALCADCDILTLAHHGSRNGQGARWLGLVSPRLAVASVGLDNEFGYPHAGTVALLDRAGVPLLRTGEAGTITVITDGKVLGGHEPSPRGEGEGGGEWRQDPAVPEGERVDLDAATEAELDPLSRIGRMLVGGIVKGRPSRSVEDSSGCAGSVRGGRMGSGQWRRSADWPTVAGRSTRRSPPQPSQRPMTTGRGGADIGHSFSDPTPLRSPVGAGA